MTEKTPNQDVQHLREEYRAKVFRMMLYIAGIFGIPAVAAFFLGAMLDERLASGGKTYQLIALAIAFVLSWVWVFRLYSKLNKEAKEIEDKAKQEKEQQPSKEDLK